MKKIKHFQKVITLSEHSLYRIGPCSYWEQKWQPSLESVKHYQDQLHCRVLPMLHTVTASADTALIIPRNL